MEAREVASIDRKVVIIADELHEHRGDELGEVVRIAVLVLDGEEFWGGRGAAETFI